VPKSFAFIIIAARGAKMRKRKTKIDTTAKRIVIMTYGRLAKITSLSQPCGDFEQGQGERCSGGTYGIGTLGGVMARAISGRLSAHCSRCCRTLTEDWEGAGHLWWPPRDV
jgi:hypothetical protein